MHWSGGLTICADDEIGVLGLSIPGPCTGDATLIHPTGQLTPGTEGWGQRDLINADGEARNYQHLASVSVPAHRSTGVRRVSSQK